MTIDLTCPHCHAQVAAREADRGQTIRCGICWKDVPVPGASSPPAPVRAAVLPTAKLLPSKPTSGAAPRPAAPVKVVPVAPVPVPVSPVRGSGPPKSRTARRDDDEDDIRDRSPRKSSVGTLVLVSVIGFALVGAVTAGVIYLVGNSGGDGSADGGKPTAKDGYVEPKPLWDPSKDKNRTPVTVPPFNPGAAIPPVVPGVKPPAEPEWKPVGQADGFEALVPGAMPAPTDFQPLRINIELGGGDVVKGKKYGSLTVNVFRVVFCGFEIHYADFPDGPFDAESAMRKMHIELRPEWPATPTTLAGLPAVEIGAGITPPGVSPPVIQGMAVRGVKVGPRFFTAKFTYLSPDLAPKWPEYRDKFFASFKITYDPATPAPMMPARPGRGGPVTPAPVTPAVTPTGLSPYVVAKPQPFWAAVFVPDKNEFLTVGPRLLGNFGKGSGVLRRYSLPGFQLKASYPLPRTATRAAYDVATSTLYCTTLTGTRNDTTVRDSERVVAFGDVEAYDLTPVFKGTTSEKDELKPVWTVPFSGAKLTGLDLSPDGKWLYTVRTTQLGTPTKPRGWKASLVRIDVGQRKVNDPIDLPMPVLQMTLSADGKTLYLAEVPLSDFGGEVFGGGSAGKVNAVDVAAWRLDHNVLFPGTVLDLALTKDGSRLVCGLQTKAGASLVTAGALGGDVLGFDPTTDPARTAGYVGVSADGKRIVTAARMAEGIDVYELTDPTKKDGLKLLARGKEAAGGNPRTPLGGHFYLSPDGRYAAFQVGAVIDVEHPTKKPE